MSVDDVHENTRQEERDAIVGLFAKLNDQAVSWQPHEYESNAHWTRKVKDELASLGEARGYYVCCHRVESGAARWGEWLYDLCWLKEMKGSAPLLFTDMLLAAESEWTISPWELMNDFQKLVFSKARICLMVWQNHDADALKRDTELMHKQVLSAGDDVARYLLVPYNRKMKRFVVHKWDGPAS